MIGLVKHKCLIGIQTLSAVWGKASQKLSLAPPAFIQNHFKSIICSEIRTLKCFYGNFGSSLDFDFSNIIAFTFNLISFRFDKLNKNQVSKIIDN